MLKRGFSGYVRFGIITALFLYCLLFISVALAGAEVTVPGQGVWLFDQDVQGTTVHDSSVYGHDGTRFGNVTISTDTPFAYSDNLSAAFDGTDGYISIPSAVSMLKEDSATVECWFRFSSGALQTGTHQIIGGTMYGRSFLINQTGDHLYIYWRSGPPVVKLLNVLPGVLNQWNHIALTVSQGMVSVYLNGALQDTQPAGTNQFNPDVINIGGNEHYSGWTINGLVDEVRILDYPLGAGDIMANYQSSLKKEHALPGSDRKLAMYQTEFSPAVLLHSTDNSISLFQEMESFGLGRPKYLALVNSGSNVAVYRLDTDSIPADISEPWMLAWFNGGTGWEDIQFIQKPSTFSRGEDPYGTGTFESPEDVGAFDVPWLIVLQHRPSSISNGPDGLDLTFGTSAGYVRMMPLYGIERLDPAVTGSWADSGLPGDIVQRSREWAGILQNYPVGMQEAFAVDHAENRININDRFEYLRIEDDWDTTPVPFAPISPALGLIIRYAEDEYDPLLGYNHLVSSAQTMVDMDYMTPYGPLYGIKNTDEFAYRLLDLNQYANETAFVDGVSGFSTDQIDDLKTRLDDIADKYVNKLSPPGEKTDGNITYDNRCQWEAFYGPRQGMDSAFMAKLLPYMDGARQAEVSAALNCVLNEYLDSDNYTLIRDEVRGIDYLMFDKRWERKGWSDLHSFGTSLYSMYVLAEALNRLGDIDSDMVRKIWNALQYQDWVYFSDSSSGDHLNPMIEGSWAMARMAAHKNDQANYDLGVYSGAKFLLNRYSTLRAVDYAYEMGQWAHWMDPATDYVYWQPWQRKIGGTTDRLDWSNNTMGYKFHDPQVMGGFGWIQTFINRLNEENYDRFFYDKAPGTAGLVNTILDANRVTEEKLINGITTASTKSYHWEIVGWHRDQHTGAERKVEIIMETPLQYVERIEIGSLSRTQHGIYYPLNIEVYVEEGGNWTWFGSTGPDMEGISDSTNGEWHTFSVSGNTTETGSIRIVAEMNSNAGQPTGYLFSDEIEAFGPGGIKIAVQSISSIPEPNYLNRKKDWFPVEHMLAPLTAQEIYDRLKVIYDTGTPPDEVRDMPLNDAIWRTLHAGEGWPFENALPDPFNHVDNLYQPGIDYIRLEGRSVGYEKNRLEHARSSFAMLSENYRNNAEQGWPLLSWYGFIAPSVPGDVDPSLQNMLPFGYVKPSAAADSPMTAARIIRSSNLMGVYTVGDVLGEWPLNEGTGLELTDISGNSGNIFLPTTANESEKNPSWHLDESGQYVMEFNLDEDILENNDVIVIPENDLYVFKGNGYVEVWAGFNTLPTGTHQIIGTKHYGPNNPGFLLSQNGRKLYVYSTTGGPATFKSEDIFETGKWYRIIMAIHGGILTAKVEEHAAYGSDTPVVSWELGPEDIGIGPFNKYPIYIGGNVVYRPWTIDGYIGKVRICSSGKCAQGEGGGCTDSDGDRVAAEGGVCGPVDCDDNDPDINPEVAETCDGINNNCDGFIDEGFADTDLDNIKDCVDPDDDNDGLSDSDEINIYSTDPLNPDTDSDGSNDGEEIQSGTLPLHPDTDRDGVPDGEDSAPIDIFSPHAEGWKLSKNSDFSTSDAEFSTSDSFNIIVWSNVANAEPMKKKEYKIKNTSGDVHKEDLGSTELPSVYKENVALSGFSAGRYTVEIWLRDDNNVEYEVKDIYLEVH